MHNTPMQSFQIKNWNSPSWKLNSADVGVDLSSFRISQHQWASLVYTCITIYPASNCDMHILVVSCFTATHSLSKLAATSLI